MEDTGVVVAAASTAAVAVDNDVSVSDIIINVFESVNKNTLNIDVI